MNFIRFKKRMVLKFEANKNNKYTQRFDFDPVQFLNENWGPVGLKWKNYNTILLEYTTHDNKGGSLTLYKVVQFGEE